ncbi:TetR/AcrR family transcriptional regulator [Streptomyces sp. NPDC087270]|uniref:TetR/AcrR family transcriptional regulator n=1 Tax=Streptomyces sp. NPDC087270 TaxID=3365774 RepID=UPI00380A2262
MPEPLPHTPSQPPQPPRASESSQRPRPSASSPPGAESTAPEGSAAAGSAAAGPAADTVAADTVDVRVLRTRQRLREAVLLLASRQPVEEIAVADLVRAARVNRTTFYKHAASPAHVLEEVLYAELDRIRANWIADTVAARLPADEIWERASNELADHLERHDALYTAGLAGQRSAILYRLLVDHFTASVHALLARDPHLLPDGEGSVAWRTEAHSRFVAHGEAGVVEAWISLPAPRDRRLFVSAVAAALPAWLVPGAPASRPGARTPEPGTEKP